LPVAQKTHNRKLQQKEYVVIGLVAARALRPRHAQHTKQLWIVIDGPHRHKRLFLLDRRDPFLGRCVKGVLPLIEVPRVVLYFSALLKSYLCFEI
jgi:hypothetical protein